MTLEDLFKLMARYKVTKYQGPLDGHASTGHLHVEVHPSAFMASETTSFEGPATNEDEMLYWSAPAVPEVDEA